MRKFGAAPKLQKWKFCVILFHYMRVDRRGIEPLSDGCKPTVLPLNYRPCLLMDFHSSIN